jgi:hypothetical protein
MKKLLSVVLAIALSSFVITANAAAPDEEWRQSPPPTSDASWGILAEGITQTYTMFAHPQLMSFKADKYEIGTGKVLTVKVCHSFAESECPRDEYQKYGAPVGMCNAESSDCIEEVAATTTSGEKLVVTFVKDFPGKTGWEFVGDKAANLPTSGSSFLVDVPGAPHASGSLYVISSILGGTRMPSQSAFGPATLETSIWPVRLIKGNFNVHSESTDPAMYSGLGINTGGGGGGDYCDGVQTSTTECAMPEAAPLNVAFSLKFKLTTSITGWLSGRMSNVDATLTKDANGVQRLSVSALAVRVPTIFGWVKKSETPADLARFYSEMDPFVLNMGNGYGKCLDPAGVVGPCNPKYWESVLRNPGNSQYGMKEFALWMPIIKDTAVAAPTAWYFHNESGNIGGQCVDSQSQITGLVTTNATVFIPGPPSFNESEGSLDYKVLAPHSLADGTVFKGTYDLLISSALARCIYKFTSAPIKATVSVVSEAGITQVVTTTISERDGFIHLAANGFTFSNPTIKVKLTQDVVVVAPTPTPTPTPTPVVTETPAPTPTPTPTVKPAAKKITITCVKGKATKKVTAIKPVCPAGYKRK